MNADWLYGTQKKKSFPKSGHIIVTDLEKPSLALLAYGVSADPKIGKRTNVQYLISAHSNCSTILTDKTRIARGGFSTYYKRLIKGVVPAKVSLIYSICSLSAWAYLVIRVSAWHAERCLTILQTLGYIDDPFTEYYILCLWLFIYNK